MATLITWLTWPKQMSFQGLTYENLWRMSQFIKGPNYLRTITIDLIIIGIIAIIYVIKSSSKKDGH